MFIFWNYFTLNTCWLIVEQFQSFKFLKKWDRALDYKEPRKKLVEIFSIAQPNNNSDFEPDIWSIFE